MERDQTILFSVTQGKPNMAQCVIIGTAVSVWFMMLCRQVWGARRCRGTYTVIINCNSNLCLSVQEAARQESNRRIHTSLLASKEPHNLATSPD